MRCAACGAEVDASDGLRFTCPRASADDGVDHLLIPVPREGAPWPDSDELNPFLRYRTLLFPYRFARGLGLSDEGYCELVVELDDAIAEVDGAGFRETPLRKMEELGADVWVKDETRHVGGSHKARHLMGVMIALLALDRIRGREEALPRLAIASCGNAALAAAVIARAAPVSYTHLTLPTKA